MNKKVLFISSLAVFIFSSCYYDVEEELYPNNCTSSNVTFSATVNPILNTYGCVGCHSGSAPSGNTSLLGHANVLAKVTDGKLWGVINHHPGFPPMPQGGAKMSACDISRVKAWIDAGAPNN